MSKVTLRAIEREDLQQLRDWRNQLLCEGTVRQWYLLNMDDQEAWFRHIQKHDEDIMFAVDASVEDSARLVGVVGLTHTDWVRRCSEISIFVGDEEARGHDVGTKALRCLCEYGFETVGMHRLWAEVFAHNTASIRLFEKANFVREGAMRERHFFQGKWIDSIIMSKLDREWALT
jgi:hypothetical protein